jgi:HSP20 family molecular chaperone IbpA
MSTHNKLASNAQAQNAQPQTTQTQAQAEKIEQRPAVAPPVDVYENENELLVIADMPGVAQDKMGIHFDKGRLTIEGNRQAPQWAARTAEAENVDFRRTFLVPQGIDAEHITAELSAGVLQVHLPKHASVKPRRIEVKAG